MIDKEVFATSVNDTLLGGLGATQKVGEKREGDKEILTKFFTQDIK